MTAVNGIVYAVGGGCNCATSGGIYNTLEAYDPAANTWSTKAPMPTARQELAVGVINGILYAIGGNGPGSPNVVEAYDPAANSWSTKAPMPTGRYGLAAVPARGAKS